MWFRDHHEGTNHPAAAASCSSLDKEGAKQDSVSSNSLRTLLKFCCSSQHTYIKVRQVCPPPLPDPTHHQVVTAQLLSSPENSETELSLPKNVVNHSLSYFFHIEQLALDSFPLINEIMISKLHYEFTTVIWNMQVWQICKKWRNEQGGKYFSWHCMCEYCLWILLLHLTPSSPAEWCPDFTRWGWVSTHADLLSDHAQSILSLSTGAPQGYMPSALLTTAHNHYICGR